MTEWKWIKNILEAIKLPKKYIFWLFLLSGMFIFLLSKEEEWLITYGIDTIIKQYKPYLILIFIASGSLLLIEISIYLWEKIKNTFSKKYRNHKIKRKINSLGQEEKAILREFFLHQVPAIRLPINNNAVDNLFKKYVLTKNAYDSGEMSTVGSLYLMSISEEAKPLIKPELIDWPKNKNRPWFMEVIEKTRKQTSWMAL